MPHYVSQSINQSIKTHLYSAICHERIISNWLLLFFKYFCQFINTYRTAHWYDNNDDHGVKIAAVAAAAAHDDDEFDDDGDGGGGVGGTWSCYRGTSWLGPFVTMIFQMCRTDCVQFLCIYVVFMSGFTQSIYLLTRLPLAAVLRLTVSDNPDVGQIWLFRFLVGHFWICRTHLAF